VPPTRLILYRNDDGSVPLLEWLEGLSPKARAKCRVRLERLAELGHELRRPEADTLRDGIHELRAKDAGINLRILLLPRAPDGGPDAWDHQATVAGSNA
jgi:hypothetical protein